MLAIFRLILPWFTKVLAIKVKISFCYGLAWLFHFKMSPNRAMLAQCLRNGSTFSPVQSTFELPSVKRAQIRRKGYIFDNLSPSGLGCYWLLPALLTRLLCLLHNTYIVGIIQSAFQWKKSLILTSTPSPTLPTRCAAGSIRLQAVTLNYSTCISYNFSIFCPSCLKFSHKFLHTYSFMLSIIRHNCNIRRFRIVDPLKYHTYMFVAFLTPNIKSFLHQLYAKLFW